MRTLCVILAKGHSSRLPDKNIKPFAGTNLTRITVDQAHELKSLGYFDEAVLDSDSPKILDEAVGKIAYHSRNPGLREDDVDSVDLILDVTGVMEATSIKSFDRVVLLQVTEPLRRKVDIIKALSVQSQSPNFPLFSVVSRECVITERALDTRYQLTGMIYIWPRDKIIPMFHFRYEYKEYIAFNIPRERAISIDYQWEFDLAEFLYERERKLGKSKD